jgi:hypothetical protein
MLFLGLAIIAIASFHLARYQNSEPFFSGDETRHVMTGVFFRDFCFDLPLDKAKEYTTQYYLQYPALGLFVWPPFFHMLEGAVMVLTGPTFITSKIMIGLFSVVALIYLYKLVSMTRENATALLAVLVFGLSPLVFRFSSQVMLEMPALACSMGFVYHLKKFLGNNNRRSDFFIVCIWFSLALLTRYDCIFLIPLFLLVITPKKLSKVCLNKTFFFGILIVSVLLVPYYLIMLKEYGWMLLKGATEGTIESGTSLPLFSIQRLIYYPSILPKQIGWCACLFAVIGLISSILTGDLKDYTVYLSIIASTYFIFTPMAELESRHSIYWVPAFAYFAAEGVRYLERSSKQKGIRQVLSIIILGGTIWATCQIAVPYLRGYDQAAEYIVNNSNGSKNCFISSYFNGSFIYSTRCRDPKRKLRILRASKLLYGVICTPQGGYKEFVQNQDEVLLKIYQTDPEYLVIEVPYAGNAVGIEIPMADLVIQTIKKHSERFQLVHTIPIDTNQQAFNNVNITIYKNLYRNPNPNPNIEYEMLSLKRTIQMK